ncbi:GNAT family N-acetyltransferase [Micromonospora sp. C28SCA-DRY-2]|uniref:GNAT family N-acetyltransferase n=1 Tax=Micromonospora sp. C28SCA-DRY-2 TaxID=3059522 RepID=UPI0026775D77|nr:GNAT family N-acetyltransferase [Micromonospora sp. C28SCA-DRY-2]MDO3702633.1 GNAT family N-acetyltransferase [Micromonospora sp. C28SCA-DRY-2]
MVDVVISPVLPVDVGEILTLQRAAYVTEAQLYSDASLPALTQTYDELAAELGSDLALKATMGHRIVGSVRARLEGSVLHIGRLVVAPDLQGRGIGTRLLTAVEREAAGKADRYTLFTGHLSRANIRLYERHGYTEVRRVRLTSDVVLVHLEKPADR